MSAWVERAADIWTRGRDSLVRLHAEWWLLHSEPPRMRLLGPFLDRETAMAAADDEAARLRLRKLDAAAPRDSADRPVLPGDDPGDEGAAP